MPETSDEQNIINPPKLRRSETLFDDELASGQSLQREDMSTVCIVDRVNPSDPEETIKPNENARSDEFRSSAKTSQVTSFLDYLDNIRCRTEQVDKLNEFFRSQIARHTGGVTVMCGPPGSGKTYVANTLTTHCSLCIDDVEIRRVAYINCVTCGDTKELLRRCGAQLGIENCTTVNILQKHKPRCTDDTNAVFNLIILDEIDHFSSSRDISLLLRLCEAAMTSSTLFVIAIANSLNVYELISSNSQAAIRNNIVCVKFTPYSREDMVEILRSLVADFASRRKIEVDDSVLLLCASKFSLTSGDIRDSMNCLEQAIESAQQKRLTVVQPSDLLRAIGRLMGDGIDENYFLRLPLSQRVLAMVVEHLLNAGRKPICSSLFEVTNKLLKAVNEQRISESDFWLATESLTSAGVLEPLGKRSMNVEVHMHASFGKFQPRLDSNPFFKFVKTQLEKIKI